MKCSKRKYFYNRHFCIDSSLIDSITGGMNHYKDEGYGSQSNVRMQHTGYIQAPQAHNVVSKHTTV